MAGLVAADYLALTAAAARSQWRSVAARAPVPEGKRQVDFLPVETLTCLVASLVVNHRRYGSSTNHKAEEPVPSLARLFRRPNSSVLAKMANLDGTRSHGGRHEIEVAAALLPDTGRLEQTYRLLVSSARDAGIGADRLPDFLGLAEGAADLFLLGQEELRARDVEPEVARAAARWAQAWPDVDRRTTERLLLGAVRIGQHRFARAVLCNHGHRCVFCGLGVVHKDGRPQRMLVASHIKAWRHGTAAERLDPANGLSACPTHDVAFDVGVLGVTPGLAIEVAPGLGGIVRAGPEADAVFGTPPLSGRLVLPDGADPPRPVYLAWHREKVFLG
jgi:putative restriction endonuclease